MLWTRSLFAYSLFFYIYKPYFQHLHLINGFRHPRVSASTCLSWYSGNIGVGACHVSSHQFPKHFWLEDDAPLKEDDGTPGWYISLSYGRGLNTVACYLIFFQCHYHLQVGVSMLFFTNVNWSLLSWYVRQKHPRWHPYWIAITRSRHFKISYVVGVLENRWRLSHFLYPGTIKLAEICYALVNLAINSQQKWKAARNWIFRQKMWRVQRLA